jgi:NAD(P)-dependent dehydrogenase (short-subunit alcohol dehydrogenase family)
LEVSREKFFYCVGNSFFLGPVLAFFDAEMSQPKLKPLDEQVAVVFGASSGIGRATALQMAKSGASVVVAARNEDGLQSLVDEIEREGGEAFYVVADAGEYSQIHNVATQAVAKYGRIDTWVHTASAAMYAKFEDTTPEEFERIVDVTLTGAAWGAMAALPHLKLSGGALIQVSSVESIVGLPYQSAYAAAKHGMKAYLDILRVELDHDDVPVSVTNIMPAGINTPFFSNARTKIGVKPVATPPLYQPHIVAGAICAAAQKPIPEIVVGGAGVVFALSKRFAPHLTDMFLRLTQFRMQKTPEPKSADAPTNLFSSDTKDTRVEGDFSDSARGTSLGTWLETHPSVRTGLAYGVLGALGLWVMKKRD